MSHRLNDICKDCPKRAEDCHSTCEKYARELKKHRFMLRWEYDNSLADRYLSGCRSKVNAFNAKDGQARRRYKRKYKR